MPALTILSILIFIVILGVLITIHEFGHYIAAKKGGIRVFEFAIGMGPKIWKKQKGETLYSIRAFPIGGFCNMEEDDEAAPDDQHAFPNAKKSRRALVLAAGSLMNFLLGFVILFGLNLTYPDWYISFREPVVTGTMEGFEYAGEEGFLPGDRIVKINGHRVNNYLDVSTFLEMGVRRPGESFDVVLLRDGRKIALRDLDLTRKEYTDQDGNTGQYFGFYFNQSVSATVTNRLKGAWFDSVNKVRGVWLGLSEIVRGRVQLKEISGPVGMGDMVNSIVQQQNVPVKFKTFWLFELMAVLALNLGVMNLLPIPGLDGSRLIFVGIEAIRGKPIKREYEGYVHFVGFVLLIAFMVVVMFSDLITKVF